MKTARSMAGSNPKCHDLRPPRSNFDFIEKHFGKETAPDQHTSIRRLFSLARSFGCKCVVVEDLPDDGLIRLENEEIAALWPDHRMPALRRLSFWRSGMRVVSGIRRRKSEDLIGYAVLKKDEIPSKGISRWHVFESVFRQCPLDYTCIPTSRRFRIRVANSQFSVRGDLYCQQNGLNKSCAQVALRTILLLRSSIPDVSYSRINAIAGNAFKPQKKGDVFQPGKGLQPAQIAAVLDAFGVEHTSVDYSGNKALQQSLPYQRLLYSGIESGAGALLGFSLKTPGKHIIPLFGHTFNKDAWRNYADTTYFKPGLMQYIPSDSWLGSFVGHDDNFGPNFCIPRLHVDPTSIGFVSVLHPEGFKYPGLMAEAIASMYLDSLLGDLNPPTGAWFSRLLWYAQCERLVLRTVAVKRSDYIRHLRNARDWRGRRENQSIPSAFESLLPTHLWMVEASIPDLFPTNRSKLGEILLNATIKPTQKLDYGTFVLARLPQTYAFHNPTPSGKSKFSQFPSNLHHHTRLF